VSVRRTALGAIEQLEAGLPRISPSNGALEALKWLALCLMTLDHVNKYLWSWDTPWAYTLGRLAMPIFAMTLAFNLSRSALPARTMRVARRLLVYGIVASAPFIALGHTDTGLPLNILFTFGAATTVIALLQIGRRRSAIGLFAAAGALTEFSWPGLGLVLAAYAYCVRPTASAVAGVVLSLAFLGALNGNHWAFAGAALFVAAGAIPWPLNVGRGGSFFYAYYPAHLVVLLALQDLR